VCGGGEVVVRLFVAGVKSLYACLTWVGDVDLYIALFAFVYEGGRQTELAHVFEPDAVVSCVEGAFEVRVHYVYGYVVNFGVFHHHDDGCEKASRKLRRRRNPSSWSLRMP
jgi:hypothetical protein